HEADEEAGIAKPGEPERLARLARRPRPLVPIADQKVRAEADQLQEDEHLQKAGRQHEAEHREREQRLVGVVAAERRRRLVGEIGPRVHLHEERDQRDEHAHLHGHAVDPDADRGHGTTVRREPRRQHGGVQRAGHRDALPRHRGGAQQRAGHGDDGDGGRGPAAAAQWADQPDGQEARERQGEHQERELGRAEAHAQPRSRSRWSASMLRRTRKITMTMARPTATSATVIAMVNSVKISPARSSRKREKATRLTFTALSISSMPSRMPTAFLRVSTPKSPMANTSAARMRYAWSGTVSPPSARSRARRGARSPAARRGAGAVPRRARPAPGPGRGADRRRRPAARRRP